MQMNYDYKKLQFIIHRGSHQIGGNCVEVKTPEARIIIDCGLPLDYDDQDSDIQKKIHEDAKGWLDRCDAVFLSHYHGDHYGLLSDAPRGTKVYTSKETAELMKVSGIFGEDLTEHLDIQVMDGTVAVKDFRVTAYPVDHSAYGACAFHFEVADKSILYSGDIRIHGKKGVLYKNLPQNVDYLFLEGTNIGRGTKQRTETDMENEFIKQFDETPDSVHLVWCSSQNIDRIVALYRACKRTGRALCIDPFVAYVLELAHKTHTTIPTAKTHTNLLIFYPHRLTSKMIEKDPELIFGPYVKKRKLDVKLLQSHPGKYVMLFRPSLLYYAKTYLNEVKVYLTNSIWAQYWEKNKTDINCMKEWLEEKPELRKKLPDIHTSGHADIPSLQKIVKHVQPKHIVPIHSEYSDSFSSLFPNTSVMEVMDEIQYSVTDPAIWKSTNSFEDLEVGFYLTDVSPDRSGVPATIFAACKNPCFSPRILLSADDRGDGLCKGKIFSISLDKIPTVIDGDENLIPDKVIEKAKIWTIVNYNLLMRLWCGEIDSLAFLNEIKKI